MATGKRWTRDELLVALNLYYKLPFGLFHERNPTIIDLAERMGRTPGSLAMKLSNLASLDPVEKARGIKGLEGASAHDQVMWDEFHRNREQLTFESERLYAELMHQDLTQLAGIHEEELPREGKERERIVRVRVNQYFFRATVLAAYGHRCCITGLSVPALLNASHILPWAKSAAERLDPRNGLCLNALHDRAFDRGLLTITPEFRVKLSPVIHEYLDDPAVEALFKTYDNVSIHLPQRFSPKAGYLAEHNKTLRASTSQI